MQIVINYYPNNYLDVEGALFEKSMVHRYFPDLEPGKYDLTIRNGNQFWLSRDSLNYLLDSEPHVVGPCFCEDPSCIRFVSDGPGLKFCRRNFEDITGIKLKPGHTMQVDIELCKL